MSETGQDVACETMDISAGGIALKAPRSPKIGEAVIAYLEHLGRLEGTVVRRFAEGFALALKMPAGRQERLGEKLSYLDRHKSQRGKIRLHERIVPTTRTTIVTIDVGVELPAEIIDFSRNGVGLVLPLQVPNGTVLCVGRSTRGTVVRVDGTLTGVEFSRLLPLEALDPGFEF
ncbi:MAG: PilZ domain-containing protein [Beijerinckiaceae bacterium]